MHATFASEEEWGAAEEVQVSLAGDQTTVMRLTRAGTLLLPPGSDGLVPPVVPMGAIIEQLGYKLVFPPVTASFILLMISL